MRIGFSCFVAFTLHDRRQFQPRCGMYDRGMKDPARKTKPDDSSTNCICHGCKSSKEDERTPFSLEPNECATAYSTTVGLVFSRSISSISVRPSSRSRRLAVDFLNGVSTWFVFRMHCHTPSSGGVAVQNSPVRGAHS